MSDSSDAADDGAAVDSAIDTVFGCCAAVDSAIDTVFGCCVTPGGGNAGGFGTTSGAAAVARAAAACAAVAAASDAASVVNGDAVAGGLRQWGMWVNVSTFAQPPVGGGGGFGGNRTPLTPVCENQGGRGGGDGALVLADGR